MHTQNHTGKLKIELLNAPCLEERVHADPELLYVLTGRMDLRLGTQQVRLDREGIYVVNGGKRYSFHTGEHFLMARVILPYQLIRESTHHAEVIFWCDSTQGENGHYDSLRRILNQLLNRYLSIQQRGEDFGYISLCFQLLDQLTANFMLRLSDRELLDEEARFEARVMQIEQYISANYASQISSKDLADSLFLSQGYLSRFIKRHFGTNFAEYLNSVRLSHAMDDLLFTDLPLTRIAYDNGFPNMAAFNKAFKAAYEGTPSALRKKLKQEAREISPDQSEVRSQLEQFLEQNGQIAESETDSTQLEAVCPVRECSELQNVWQDTLNIGSAADLLRSEVREHVLMLSRLLNVSHIRFWNIFSPEMLISPEAPGGKYNFSKLDAILDFLVENGLYPHIELGLKPRRVYRNVQRALVEDRILSDWNTEHMERFLESMMRHLIRRYRRVELDHWRLELWFQESVQGDPAAMDDYFRLFNRLYETAKCYAGQIEVGGCGLRGDYVDDQNYIPTFLRTWKAQPNQPDFLSMGFYSYERGKLHVDRDSKRSTDNEHFLRILKKMRSLIENAGMGHVPLYVTEWNLSVSDRNYINDTCFKGAYIVKNMIDCYGLTQLAAYFLGSDLVSEHFDSEGPFYGGCALLSKDGILKPSGCAFRFLKWLYPYYVGRGRNYLVTTDRHDDYGIILHNQKKLGYQYYLSREDELEREHLWKYYENRDALELTLALDGVADGVYQVKTYLINANTGSPMKIWGDLGFERELSRNDVKYLERVCGPKLTIQSAAAEEGRLTLKTRLEANEIRFIRIRRVE